MVWNPPTFILNLPNKPVGRKDLPNSQPFVAILAIAVAHSIHKRFMQTELNSLSGHRTVDRLNQLIHQRRKPQRGGMIEISPAKHQTGNAFHVVVIQAFGMTKSTNPRRSTCLELNGSSRLRQVAFSAMTHQIRVLED